MNNATRLKKMNKRAREIQARTGCKYSVAQKKAGAEMRGAKVSGTTRTAPRKRKPAKKRAVGSTRTNSAPRRSASRPAARPSKKRTISGTVAQTKSKLKKQLEEKLAWQLLARESAHRVRDRRKKGKAIAETKKELRAIGGLKRR